MAKRKGEEKVRSKKERKIKKETELNRDRLTNEAQVDSLAHADDNANNHIGGKKSEGDISKLALEVKIKAWEIKK